MIQKKTFSWCLLALLINQFMLMSAHATEILTDIITTPLKGTNAELAFDFNAGNGNQPNSITISSFSTNGTLSTVNPTLQGDVTGNLSSTVTLNNTQPKNEFIQAITLGNSLSFIFNTTQNFASSTSLLDTFSIYLLNTNGQSLITTTDVSNANSLLSFTIDGTTNGKLNLNTDTSKNPVIWSVGVSNPIFMPTPIPGTFWLFATALMVFGCNQLRKVLQSTKFVIVYPVIPHRDSVVTLGL